MIALIRMLIWSFPWHAIAAKWFRLPDEVAHYPVAAEFHGNQHQMKTLPIDAAYPTWHREVFEVLSWSLRVNSRASCGAEPNCGIMQLARPHWHALLSSTQSLKKSSPRSIVSELPNCAQLVGAKASPTDRWPRAHRAPQGLNASTKEKKKKKNSSAKTRQD